MARILVEDEIGITNPDSPPKRLSLFLQANWVIVDPPASNILWDAWWIPSLVTIKFNEIATDPSPMVCGWGKWDYRSTIQLVITAWNERNGDYPAVITKVRNRIEDLIHTDVRAMANPYGISAMRILRFNDHFISKETERYKDSTSTLELQVYFIYSKTVKVV